MTYPTDDAGNTRVDFVWGNMPLQPNDQRQGWVPVLGYGEVEYMVKGHAKRSDWPFNPDFKADYMFPSEYLGSDDNHKVALTEWGSYPSFEANIGLGNLFMADQLGNRDSAFYQPNIIAKPLAEAVAQLKSL